jgi:hypothetical protein
MSNEATPDRDNALPLLQYQSFGHTRSEPRLHHLGFGITFDLDYSVGPIMTVAWLLSARSQKHYRAGALFVG